MTVENQKRAGDQTREIHNLERILRVILVASPLVALSFAYLAWQMDTWQLYVLAVTAGLPAFATGFIYSLLRKGQTQTAAWLVLALVLVDLMVGPLLYQGLGILLGLGAVALGIFISGQVLPRQWVDRGSYLGIAACTVNILMDVFGPATRLPVPNNVVIVLGVFLTAVILFLGFSFFRQINNYSLRIKQIVGLISIAIISTGGVSLAINRTAQSQIEQQVYAGVNDQANYMAIIFGNEVAKQLELLSTLSLNGVIIQAVQDANSSYPADEVAIQAKIMGAAQQWQTAVAAKKLKDPLVQATIAGPAANELRLFRLLFADHAEVFITDRYGALVASTNTALDFNQATQPWWQIAYQNQRGELYVDTPELDEVSRKYAITMALPILDSSGNFIGFLNTSYRIAGLIQRVANARVGYSSNANLLFPDGKLLDGGGTIRLLDPELQTNLNEQTEYQQIFFLGKERIVGQATLDSDSTLKNFIRSLNWKAVVDEDPIMVSLPLQAITQTSLLIGLGTLLVATFFAILAGRYMSGPITRLTQVAEAVQAGDLNARAVVESQDEIGILAETFNSTTDQLQSTLQELEHRVAERTTELEQRSKDLADRTVALELANVRTQKRAAQLQAISDVARTIAGVRKLSEILPKITQVVSEQFGFYHTGVFLLDEAGEYAMLSAANSIGGKRMLARGHRLKVGAQGIVGYVTGSGNPRIALDTGADATYFNNPDLPETHSEMAIPLKSGGKIIGALDVQSNQSNAFSKEDLDVIQVLADQISIAIDNSRQFDQTQKSLGEAETIYRQYLRREWDKLGDSESVLGYRYSVTGIEQLDQLLENPKPQAGLPSGSAQTEINLENNESTLAVPITIHDEIIGMLNIRTPGRRSWKANEIEMVKSVADRVAISAENARLFEETTSRAERERTVSEITSKIRSTNDPTQMIQIALNELKQALRVKEAQVGPYRPPQSEEELK